jgi:DNA polymerase III epsilon subunit-like protein
VSNEQIIAVDVETTGVNPTTDDVIEIGAVRLHPRTLETIDEFTVALFPSVPVSPEAASVNGYSDEEWRRRGAQECRLVAWDLFNDWVGKVAAPVTWLACNAQFDASFIGPHVKHEQSYRLIDVHSVFRAYCHVAGLEFEYYAGGYQRKVLGIHNPSKHKALPDARMAADLYREMVRRFTIQASATKTT